MDGNQQCFICNKLFNFVDGYINSHRDDHCADANIDSDVDVNNILSKNVQTFFLLRHVIGLPLDKLEAYLKSCNDNEPGSWIKLCQNCNQFVEKSQEIYKEMVLITRDFNNLRKAVIQTIISTTAAVIVDEGNYGGHYHPINNSPENLDIAGDCRRFIQNQREKYITDLDLIIPTEEESTEIEESFDLAADTESTGDDDVTIIEELNDPIQETNQSTNYQEKIHIKPATPSSSSPPCSLLVLKYNHPLRSQLCRPFRCNISNCSDSGVKMTAQMFSTHFHDHKLLIYKCTKCDKVFSTPNKHHWNSEHSKREQLAEANAITPQYEIVPPTLPQVPWWCPICHSEFPSDVLRNEHILKEHPNQGNILWVTCDECPGNRFFNFSELQLHADMNDRVTEVEENGRSVMEQAVPYTCTERGCGKEFMKKGSLQSHVMKASHPKLQKVTQAQLTCELCCRTYRNQFYLNQHIQSVHGSEDEDGLSFKLRCKLCGKLLPKHLGKKHMLMVHNVGRKGFKV